MLINEAVNRPVVTVETSGDAVASLLKEGSAEILKSLVVTSEIKNLGKTTAVITRVDHRITSLGECKLGKDMFVPDNDVAFRAVAGKQLAPNLSLEATQSLSIPNDCKKKGVALIFTATIYYTDTVSGIPYVQDFVKYLSVPNPTPGPSPASAAARTHRRK